MTFEHFFSSTISKVDVQIRPPLSFKPRKKFGELSVKCEEEKKEFEEEEDVNDVEGAFFLTNKYRVRH